MIKFDIDFTKNKREELSNIQNEILNILSDINILYTSLDNKVWNNDEKIKLDELFTGYYNKEVKSISNTFNNNIRIMDVSIRAYEENYHKMKKAVGGVNEKLL